MRSHTLRRPFIAFLIIIVVTTLIQNASGAPRAMEDVCKHSLKKPSGFFSRHFDGSFLKKFFKHWIPFTSTTRVNMKFYLYKKEFAECGREMIIDDVENLLESGFNADHPTRIIIHGWMSQSKGTLNRAVKNAYLSLTRRTELSLPADNATRFDGQEIHDKDNAEVENEIEADEERARRAVGDESNTESVGHEETKADEDEDDEQMIAWKKHRANIVDFNVIVVDWSLISSNVNYFGVVDLIEDLGFLLAEFVRFLHLEAGLNFDDVYLIGHSLGAQIAGSTGKQIKPFMFNTIFALDPAGPKFRNQSDEFRIDATDARYVESIQTSISLGFEDPVGNATFYPNFGKDQKKCFVYGCSHSRAHHYFAESIVSEKGFWGVRCERESEDRWLLSESDGRYRMGGEPSTPKTGTFYVKTNDKAPYAMGKATTST